MPIVFIGTSEGPWNIFALDINWNEGHDFVTETLECLKTPLETLTTAGAYGSSISPRFRGGLSTYNWPQPCCCTWPVLKDLPKFYRVNLFKLHHGSVVYCKMRITNLSLTSSPRPRNSPAISESPAAGLQHALVLDFRKADVNKRYSSLRSKFSRSSRTYSLFLHWLRCIVQRDGQEGPRVDTVHLFCSLAFPDERFWKLLEGLRPRHFLIQSNLHNECNLEPLEQLNWTLDSIIVRGGEERWDVPSKVIQYIPSLTLDYFSDPDFAPATDRSALRHLTITRNDAINIFNKLMEQFGVANDLQTLKLENDFFYEFDSAMDHFLGNLQKCTSLVSLNLAIYNPSELGSREYHAGEDSDFWDGGLEHEGLDDEESGEHLNNEGPGNDGLENDGLENEGLEDEDLEDDLEDEYVDDEDLEDEGLYDEDSDLQNFINDLPQRFPENLEHLRFRFSGLPKIVSNLSAWHQYAVNSSWMPNLKTLSFKLDIEVTPRRSANVAKLQVDKFIRLLSESHPGVQIIR